MVNGKGAFKGRMQHSTRKQILKLQRKHTALNNVPAPMVKRLMAKDLDARRKHARDKRTVGERPELICGGAHAWVKQENAKVRDAVYLESNHSPPNDCYAGSKYADIPVDRRPAHAMLFYHHRSPRGGLGGASSTGGSGVNKQHAADLRKFMKDGEFWKAMQADFRDVLNTTAPNRGFYARGLFQAALYAVSEGWITKDQLDEIAKGLPFHPQDVVDVSGDRDSLLGQASSSSPAPKAN